MIAALLALVGFGAMIYAFEGAGHWGGSIPVVLFPLYKWMNESAWNYGASELVIALVVSLLVFRWVMWWFKAMDNDRARGKSGWW